MSEQTKIWALFSIENNYDQPPNNLIAFWFKKPPFEVLLVAIGGSMESESSIIAAANIFQGKEDRFDGSDYRLEEITAGSIL